MIDSDATRCLDFTNVYANKVIRLDVSKERDIFGIERFIDETFMERDIRFGKADYSRKEKAYDKTRFNFDIVEFGEAFLGAYKPRELSDFI